MKPTLHLARYRESLEAIEFAVDRGLATHQRSIGFHTSSAGVDLLSLFLFQEKLITPGTQVQHTWFRSTKRAREKLSFDFPNKDRIIALLVQVEGHRDNFCYGSDQPVGHVRAVLTAFQELRDLFRSMGVADA